jgi:preprotein translocase subunit Sss1
MATAAVSKAAHEKSIARQKAYNEQIAQRANELLQAEQALEEKRRKALLFVAIQTALRIRNQKEAEAAAKKEIEKEQQKQMLIVGGLAIGAVGFLIYSIKK